MKTRLAFAAIMVITLSCTNSRPLSDAEKQKIKDEVKTNVSAIIKGAEAVNPDIIIGNLLNSPDFTFQLNGNIGNYEQFTGAVKAYFEPLASQKCENVNEQYTVLDNSTVLYLSSSKWEMNFKDGKIVSQNPWATELLFRKSGDQWKVASWSESGDETVMKAGSTPPELNQVELFSQFTGTWQNVDKENISLWKVKPYGKSFIVTWQTLSNGKITYEQTGVFAYDPLSDKIYQVRISKDGSSLIAPLWFTSKTSAETLFIGDMPHPQNAIWKATFNLVSPTEMTFTTKQNDKVMGVQNYKLIKE